MKVFIEKYWKEGALFSVIFAIYTLCCTPNMTWIGYDCDLGDFLNSARFAMVTHFPGYPFYTMITWLAARIPIGSEAFRLAFFVSVIPAILSVIIVYFVVRKQTANKFAPYIAALCLAGANVFFMQAIIPETYVFTAFIAISTYALIVYKKWRLSALFGGLTFACHWMMVPFVLFLFVYYKDFRKQWKILISAAILSYLYVIILGVMGNSLSMVGGGTNQFIHFILGSLIGNMSGWLSLPIWQLPQRIGLTIALFCVAFGVAVIPMIMYFRDFRKSRVLIAGAFIPFIYYFGCFQPIAIHHFAMAIPFMAVAAGLGITQIKSEKLKKYLSFGAIGVSSCLLIAMPFYYDIGVNLDKNLTATQFANTLPSLPNGSVVLNILRVDNGNKSIYANGGYGYTTIKQYDKEHNANLIPIDSLTYSSEERMFAYVDYGEYYRQQIYKDYGFIPATPCWSCFNTTPYNLSTTIEQYSGILSTLLENLSVANPNRSIYYYEQNVDDIYGGSLVKVGGNQ